MLPKEVSKEIYVFNGSEIHCMQDRCWYWGGSSFRMNDECIPDDMTSPLDVNRIVKGPEI